MLSRRQFLGSVLVSGVAGCASSPNSTFNLVSKTVAASGGRGDGYPMTPQQISALPYATLGVRIGSQPRAVVVLATIEGQDLNWVSADRVTFVTRSGRLVRTHGLARDLSATRWLAGSDPLRDFAQSGTVPARGVYRELDFAHADEQAIAVESHFELGKDETLVIQGHEHLTRRLDEIAIVRAWRWEVRNSFWVDLQSGRVWRSVQQHCPEIPAIELELLKPAAV